MSVQDEGLGEFLTEAVELLEIAEKSLLAIEQGGDFKANFDSIFRVFHNLKGASGMMGLLDLGQHMHSLENILNSTKDVGLITKEQMEFFLKGIDQAQVILGIKESSEPSAPVGTVDQVVVIESQPVASVVPAPALNDSIREFLSEAQEITNRVLLCVELMEKCGFEEATIDSIYRDIHTLKGGAYLFQYKELGDLNHSIESVLDLLRRREIELSQALFEKIYDAIALIDLSLLEIMGQKTEGLSGRIDKSITFFSLYLATPTSAAEAPQVNKVEASNVAMPELESEVMSETAVESAAATPISSPVVSLVSQAAPTATVPAPAAGASVDGDKDSGSTIRVPVSLLDKLMTLMGEMVLVRNQVIQYSNRTDDLEFLNLSQRLNVVTGEIQGEMMKTRMQPIGNALSKFSRLVRELSKDLGKKIELHLSGSETELDKTLLEAVKDPLTHIVRNSCDHGIETLQERKQAGKPEVGNIYVKSYHEGGQVIIEVSDDGKGLHRDKLIKKAIEKGILTQEKAATLSDRETVNLIFAPGFSTAAKVTNVSGRGVGMDVVRTNIEKIGGSVELQSEVNKGTTIKLKIPLTLAIVPAMIVKCENDYFAIPQLKLVELVRVEKNVSEGKIEYIQDNPVFRLRGNLLPLIHIRKVMGLTDSNIINQDVANIVVLKSDQYSFGLIVDDIQDTADIVVKPLARFLKPISVYSGATVLGDGAIALILDVAGIVKTMIASGDNKVSAKERDYALSAQKSVEDLQDFLLLRVGAKEKHAILLGYVHRLEEFKKSSVEVSGHKRLVRYRNSVLPLISIDTALELSGHVQNDNDVISVVVIEKGGALYGLEVSEILDVLTIDSELDTTLTTTSGVIGNLVTEQEVVVVVDPYLLIQKTMGLDSRSSRIVVNINSAVPLPTVNALNSGIKKVLYVEDAIFFRRHVSQVLVTAGYEVVTANNGKEAKDLLESSVPGAFDLIISDIEMPIMNGFEFAEFVKQNKTWAAVPLIALSTRSDQHHIDKGLKAGFNMYLEKMNADELLKALSQLTQRGAA